MNEIFLSDLYNKYWRYWSGRAAASAKHKNSDLKFCNSQKIRYFEKYVDTVGYTEQQKEILKFNNYG